MALLQSKGEKAFSGKGWDEKKTQDFNMLSDEMGCNSRGRSPSASAEGEADPPASRWPPGMPSACRWRTGEALRAGFLPR